MVCAVRPTCMCSGSDGECACRPDRARNDPRCRCAICGAHLAEVVDVAELARAAEGLVDEQLVEAGACELTARGIA